MVEREVMKGGTASSKAARARRVTEELEEAGFPTTLPTGGKTKQDFMVQGGTMGPGRSEEWGTPPALFEALDCELGPFDLDAAASGEWIAKCEDFITPEEDALLTEWGEIGSRVFVNPPYSVKRVDFAGEKMQTTAAFLHQAAAQAAEGRLVCALTPHRSDTRWWREAVQGKATEVRQIAGRLKYQLYEGGVLTPKAAAPYPSCVVLFTPEELRPGFEGSKTDKEEAEETLGLSLEPVLKWAGSKIQIPPGSKGRTLEELSDKEFAILIKHDPMLGGILSSVPPHTGLIDRTNRWIQKPTSWVGGRQPVYLRRIAGRTFVASPTVMRRYDAHVIAGAAKRAGRRYRIIPTSRGYHRLYVEAERR
jgi:phage N-6-adenine-methyltransferase